MKHTPKQLEALRLLEAGQIYPTLVEEEDGWYARWRGVGASSGLAVDGWVDEYVREAAMTRLTEDAEDQRHETLHDAWIEALRSRTGLVRWDPDECRAFAAELEDWSGAAEEDVAARAALTFTLDCPPDATTGTFSIWCAVPRGKCALRALGQSAYVWSPLRGLRSEPTGKSLRLPLTQGEVENFLHEGVRALRQAGYGVAGLPAEAEIRAQAEIGTSSAENADATADAIKREKLKLTIRVAGEVVTEAEIRFLLDQGSSLVFFRDHWIEVNRNILKEALRALQRGAGKKANTLSFVMGIGCIGALEVEELKSHGWLRGLVNNLQNRGDVSTAVLPSTFTGQLRPYQRAGFAWLKFLTEHGFGALLADDMGLGKTVQTIAWILSLDRTDGPVLIVAPLTLLANWRHEIETFGPSLRVYVHHGETRHLASGFGPAAQKADVVLTSYNLLVRDHGMIAEVKWTALVLDEAQAVKNAETQAARAIRALSPRCRIALTGTPIENGIEDVWALEDFLNPGFLGDLKSFRERFVRPVARDANAPAAQRLRHALEPFVLRRLKTDRTIAAEIGEKREIREWCTLTDTTRRAYEAALAAFAASTHTPGDALALLTELKLACDGFSEGHEPDPNADSKFLRLCDLLESAFAAGESVLIFTQYAKVGRWLADHLAERFKRRIPFLHGELSATQREKVIAEFNRQAGLRGTPFVLSLRAGGFGLNLTKATHVVHYDRWWNPAVENQATDRAHRIGQEKTVFVHLFVTEGTLEQHIDDMLAKKATLGQILADGQTFWNAVRLTNA